MRRNLRRDTASRTYAVHRTRTSPLCENITHSAMRPKGSHPCATCHSHVVRAASKHDAKDASLIAWVHAQRRSAPWQQLSEQRRSIRALIAQRELFDAPLRRLLTQMEPLLARHFPELETFFDLSRRKTPYRLLAAFGSPAALAQVGLPQVTEFLRKAARRTPEPDMVRGLMHAARTTAGAALVADELQLVRMMATEILRLFEMRE
jgi:hypothetical protein